MREARDPYRYAKNRVLLAPLAGYTDAAFRLICQEQGAGLTYTEMASAQAIRYANQKTLELLKPSEGERRVGVQLFGREPETLAWAAAFLEREQGEKIALFDINMGCPMPKVVNNGEGAALMREPERAAEIVSAVRAAVKLPVTVKFRKGWDAQSANAVEFACRMEQAGADGLTIHGRTRAQLYEGKADLECIRAVKRAVSIPVNGNGDVFDVESAKRMLDTGCDGLMVARGALGNPFLFAQLCDWLSGRPVSDASLAERMELAARHARLACAQKGERVAVREMRKHAVLYIKGVPGAASLRRELVRVQTLEELCAMLRAVQEAEQER